MNNIQRFGMIALVALAMAACNNGGGNDSGVVDAGGTTDTGPVDTGTDTGIVDTGVDAGTDTGTEAGPTDGGSWVDGCFVGRPVAMVEFLNRCTTAETATHTIMSPLVYADGGVAPLH